LKKELEKNPKSLKTKNKSTNKQYKKGELDAPVTGTGTFLVVREHNTIYASS
jgi:hypothetical protein